MTVCVGLAQWACADGPGQPLWLFQGPNGLRCWPKSRRTEGRGQFGHVGSGYRRFTSGFQPLVGMCVQSVAVTQT